MAIRSIYYTWLYAVSITLGYTLSIASVSPRVNTLCLPTVVIYKVRIPMPTTAIRRQPPSPSPTLHAERSWPPRNETKRNARLPPGPSTLFPARSTAPAVA